MEGAQDPVSWPDASENGALLMIRLDIRRDDGEVTRIEGVASVSAVLQSDVVPVLDDSDPQALAKALKDMPVVSLRCDTAAQIAALLGTIIGAVAEIAPEAIEPAFEVAAVTNAANPALRRFLPQGSEEGS